MSKSEGFRFFDANPDHKNTHITGRPCGVRDCVTYNCKCGGKVHSEKVNNIMGFAYHCEKCDAQATGFNRPGWVRND